MRTASRALVVWLNLAVLLVLTPLAWAQPITGETKQAVLEQLRKVVDERAYTSGVDFDKLDQHLAKHKDAIDRTVDARAFSSAVNRALREFEISHLRLLTPLTATNRRSTERIGIGVAARKTDDGLVLQEVVEGGPAEHAGLRQGDIIVKIDSEPAVSTEPLAGAEGTTLVLTIRRADGTTTEDVTVTRGKFETRRPETLTIIAPGKAVLRLPTFSVGYDSRAIEGFFKQMKDQQITLLVLDLRGNGGGRVTNLNHFLSFFLERDTEIGTNISRTLARRYQEQTKGDPTDAVAIAKWTRANFRIRAQQQSRFTGRVAVLIDRNSASASEIASTALRELRGAPLVGTPSAGAVLVSTHLPLAAGYELQFPLSDYVSIKGVRLEAHKIQPDTTVTEPRSKDPATDVGVSKAFELLAALPPEPVRPPAVPSDPKPATPPEPAPTPADPATSRPEPASVP